MGKQDCRRQLGRRAIRAAGKVDHQMVGCDGKDYPKYPRIQAALCVTRSQGKPPTTGSEWRHPRCAWAANPVSPRSSPRHRSAASETSPRAWLIGLPGSSVTGRAMWSTLSSIKSATRNNTGARALPEILRQIYLFVIITPGEVRPHGGAYRTGCQTARYRRHRGLRRSFSRSPASADRMIPSDKIPRLSVPASHLWQCDPCL